MQTPFQKPQAPRAVQPSNPDTVPARLTPGEGILTKDAVAWHGLEKLQKMEAAAKEGMTKMQQQGRVGGKPAQPLPGQKPPQQQQQRPPQQAQQKPPQQQRPPMGQPPQQRPPMPPTQMAQQKAPMMNVPQPVRAFNNGGVVTQPGYYPEAGVYQPGSMNVSKTYVPSAVQQVENQQKSGQASSAGQQSSGTGTSGSKTVGTGTSTSTTKGTGTYDPNKPESQQEYNEMKNGTNRGSPQGAGSAGGVTDDSTGTVEGGDFGRSVGEMIDSGNVQGLIDTATAPDALVDLMDGLASSALTPGLPGKIAGFMDKKGQLKDLATKDRERARGYLDDVVQGHITVDDIADASFAGANAAHAARAEGQLSDHGMPPDATPNVEGGWNVNGPFGKESYTMDGALAVGRDIPDNTKENQKERAKDLADKAAEAHESLGRGGMVGSDTTGTETEQAEAAGHDDGGEDSGVGEGVGGMADSQSEGQGENE